MDNFMDTEPSPHKTLPGFLISALIFAVPFAAINLFNVIFAGSTLELSLPFVAVIYIICGILSMKVGAAINRPGTIQGLFAGLALWIFSTIANLIIHLVTAVFTGGISLIFSVLYMVLCTPIELLIGGAMGALGGFIGEKIFGRNVDLSSLDQF